jgi:hypothetical protein
MIFLYEEWNDSDFSLQLLWRFFTPQMHIFVKIRFHYFKDYLMMKLTNVMIIALCIGLKSNLEFIARGLIILWSAKKKSLFNLWRQVM